MARSGFPRNPRKYQGGWLDLVVAGVSALLGRDAAEDAREDARAANAVEAEIRRGELELARKQDARAAELFEHYRENFMPREAALVSEAFDRPISPARAESRAATDVRGALENMRQMQGRNLRRLGVNPASGTALALDQQSRLEEAKIEAGARTRAREGVRDLNFARQASAVQLGRGLPATSAGFSGQALSSFGGQATLAAMRSRDAEASAYEAGSNYGAALGDLTRSGLEWWRNRRANRAAAEGG